MIRDHQRAITAEAHVRSVAAWAEAKDRKAYGAICMKLPVLVHQAGLTGALHHVAQLSTEPKRKVLDHLAAQLVEAGLLKTATTPTLLEHSRKDDTGNLIATTREVQHCLEWYRRFSKTILKASPTDEEDGE